MIENPNVIGEFLNLAMAGVGFVMAVLLCFCLSIHIWLFKLSRVEAIKAGITLCGGIAWAVAMVWIFINAPELLLKFGVDGMISTVFVGLYVDLLPKSKDSFESRLRERHRRGSGSSSG